MSVVIILDEFSLFCTTATRLQNEVCSQLSRLRREYGGDVTSIIQDIERLEYGIRNLREDTLNWMVTFEKVSFPFSASWAHSPTSFPTNPP